MKALSLSSGAGGMDVGFRKAGFEVVWANDIDRNACESYRANHGPHIYCGDLNRFMPELERLAARERIACLFGGPPCQGFSVAGKMDANDLRSQLVWSYMEAVRILRPQAFVMENVKALAALEKFRDIRERLIQQAADLGYAVELMVLNAKDYGAPQARERMFLVGVRGRSNRFAEAVAGERRQAPTVREVLLAVGRVGVPGNNRVCKAKLTSSPA